MNTDEPSYDILKEIDDNLGGDVKRYIEQALEISKNKAEETDAQNQIVEDTEIVPTPNWATVPSKRKRQQMLDSSDSSDDEPPEESKIRNEPDKHNDEYNESDTHKSDTLKIQKKLLSNKKLEVTKMNILNNTLISNRWTEIIAAEQKKYFYSFNIEARSIDKSNGVYGFQDKSLKNFQSLLVWISGFGQQSN
ncbi:611_t:CDS:2 [Gigaspora margarita]|uniref:611_t:CDS:1 n=1 Tax=Gigaspora margarita TaxID=4874 RepID=A0ABN7W8F7_GIGMA|nr:611_t:CDS:2 [Gigaspora margarita]